MKTSSSLLTSYGSEYHSIIAPLFSIKKEEQKNSNAAFATPKIRLSSVLRSGSFLTATTVSALVYLAFFKYLDFASMTPAMATLSYYFLYSVLIGVSSVLMGLTVYSLRSALFLARRGGGINGVGSSSSSIATSLTSGVISCSCHTSLLLPALSILGLSAIPSIAIITTLVEYQLWILTAFIALDGYLLYRVIDKIQRT
jgi:hypothetical protein